MSLIPNLGDLAYKLEQSLTIMEKILFELRDIKKILQEERSSE